VNRASSKSRLADELATQARDQGIRSVGARLETRSAAVLAVVRRCGYLRSTAQDEIRLHLGSARDIAQMLPEGA
jgi:hypothetical protein